MHADQARQERQRAVRNALGIQQLQGVTPSSDVLAIADQFIEGTLSLAEFQQRISQR